MSLEVTPPKIEIQEMPDFALSDLEKYFELADFERRPSNEQVNKILNTILTNKFYDNVFRATPLPKGRFKIFDAQHRYLAFIRARDKHGLELYDFILLVYRPEDERQAYRSINSAKRLTAADHLKAMDDHKKPFFEKLRSSVGYYRSKEGLSYLDVIYAHNYALTNRPDGSLAIMDSILDGITEKDVAFMADFVKTFIELAGPIPGNYLYKAAILRTVYQYCYRKKTPLAKDQFAKLIKFLRESQQIQQIASGRRIDNFKGVYDLIIRNEKRWR